MSLCIAKIQIVGYSLVAEIFSVIDEREVHTTMLEGRTSKELAEIRAVLTRQQAQIDALVSYFARMPQPPRGRWERHSLPELKDSDPELQATHVVSIPRMTLLSPAPARVTWCQSGHEQFVAAYDQRGERIPEYCGTFRQVGRKILEKWPGLKWEDVTVSA